MAKISLLIQLLDVFRRWLAHCLKRWPPEEGARAKGQVAEAAAARFLQRHGLRILCRNYGCWAGEIDLVAIDKRTRTLVFVEVKARKKDWRVGSPGTAIDGEKQRRITETALSFLRRFHVVDCPVRFDVVTITWTDQQEVAEIVHEANAFEATHTEFCTYLRSAARR